jgi:hypothetical protein
MRRKMRACSLRIETLQSTVGITLTSGSTSLSAFAIARSAGKLIGLTSYVGPLSPRVQANSQYFDRTA